MSQKTAFWESKFYFEDAVGNKDSITIGHDLESNSSYNPDYGEVNIKDEPWNSEFEVRASHNEAAHNLASPKVLSKKIIGSTEGGLHPTYGCLYVREVLKAFIKIKHFPLKVSWDSLSHSGFCNKKDFITPHNLSQIFPNWYKDPEFIKDPPYRCLSENSSYTIQNFHTNNNGWIDYIIDIEPNGTVDSIFGILFTFLTESSSNSPCSGKVDVKDLTEIENTINVYPNPTNSILNISYTEPLDWTFFDISGNILKAGKDFTIDVSTLVSGVYLLKIQINDLIIYKKIVKSE